EGDPDRGLAPSGGELAADVEAVGARQQRVDRTIYPAAQRRPARAVPPGEVAGGYAAGGAEAPPDVHVGALDGPRVAGDGRAAGEALRGGAVPSRKHVAARRAGARVIRGELSGHVEVGAAFGQFVDDRRKARAANAAAARLSQSEAGPPGPVPPGERD